MREYLSFVVHVSILRFCPSLPYIEFSSVSLSHKVPCSAGRLSNWQSLQKWHQHSYILSKGLFDISHVWIAWRLWTSKLTWKMSLERKSLSAFFQLFLSYNKIVFMESCSGNPRRKNVFLPYDHWRLSLVHCALNDQIFCGPDAWMLTPKQSLTL